MSWIKLEQTSKQISAWRNSPAHQGLGYMRTAAWVAGHTSGWCSHLQVLEDAAWSFLHSRSQLPASNLEKSTPLHHLRSIKQHADLDSRLTYPRPRPRPRLAYPRPRPRLSSFKTKTKTKISMSKTKTETQDLEDQYWKSMTGMNCDKQKVMASRKSSIPVVAHSKQKTCLTTVLFQQLPLLIAVYQTLARTHSVSKVQCLIDNYSVNV